MPTFYGCQSMNSFGLRLIFTVKNLIFILVTWFAYRGIVIVSYDCDCIWYVSNIYFSCKASFNVDYKLERHDYDEGTVAFLCQV